MAGTFNKSFPVNPNLDLNYQQDHLKKIWLAGGCFWGLEAYMARIYGVYDAVSGYANGKTENPTYQEVCYNNTGHAETVQITYDPLRVSLKTLLQFFFRVVDPTTKNYQGPDRGSQYRSGIYYSDQEDFSVIREVIQDEQKKYSKPIVTEVEPLAGFFLAEDYHQDYLEKNPEGYCHINLADLGDQNMPSKGIDSNLYTKPSEDEIKEKLTPLQYNVVMKNDTERPFANEYYNHYEKGIYVDIVTGEPLFSSNDKFESGCGWPSFSKPIAQEVVKSKTDTTHKMIRTEVRSRIGDGHLGHVFEDGPKELGGLRYCINSASLRFIPYEDMEKEGYGNLKS